jgi:hypothetical protein
VYVKPSVMSHCATICDLCKQRLALFEPLLCRIPSLTNLAPSVYASYKTNCELKKLEHHTHCLHEASDFAREKTEEMEINADENKFTVANEAACVVKLPLSLWRHFPLDVTEEGRRGECVKSERT